MSGIATEGFTEEQRQYLQGFMAGAAQRGALPYVGAAADGRITHDPAAGGPNQAEEVRTVFGTPVDDLCREELIKLKLNPLDAWELLLRHAEEDKFPEAENVFRFKFFGLFHVAPAQDSFMLRCRVPGCALTAPQLRCLARIAEAYGNGHVDITTRGNTQIRGIPPRHLVDTLTALADGGLTSRGAGADNIRNVTAPPTCGIDPFEVLDVLPHARALHHYILNHRDLYGLPRKFNVAFDNGGSVSAAADTNDIAFIAVQAAPGAAAGSGVFFRVLLGGITGHLDFARDTGLLIRPEESVAVAAAMIRVFNEHGDRTDRKKARLKYLLEKWGVPRFLEETGKKLAFPLRAAPPGDTLPRRPVIRHGHLGVFRQRQTGLNYAGVVTPVGRLRAAQARGIADIAERHGSGEIRLTVFQNLILPNLPDDRMDAVEHEVSRLGFSLRASSACGGIVACTGNKGCKYAAADTKGHGLALGRVLDDLVTLDRPVNIHLTGCAHSCAQHYAGDIGLIACKVGVGDTAREGYHMVLGGGMDHEQGIAREVFRSLPFEEVPERIGRVLTVYQERRQPGESFLDFTRRHDVKTLQELFCP